MSDRIEGQTNTDPELAAWQEKLRDMWHERDHWRDQAAILADLVSRLRPAVGALNQVVENPDLYDPKLADKALHDAKAAALFAGGRLMQLSKSSPNLHDLATAQTDDDRERLMRQLLGHTADQPKGEL